MKILHIAAALLAAFCTSVLFAQSPSPTTAPVQPTPPEPLIVDVHASPYRASFNVTFNISKQRFDIRNATIVNMIDFVLGRDDDDGREDDSIVGGPTWLDYDRFDVAVLIPALKADPDRRANPNEQLRPILKRILTERFHLAYHTGERPLPGFIATAAKDGPKLTEAKDQSAENSCTDSPDKANPGQTIFICTSETIGQFLTTFGGVFPHPIIDRTGLTKPYDFTFRLTTEQLKTRAGYIQALIEGFNKQLGVVIARDNVPQPAFFVDTVDKPKVNQPEIAKLIPALPDLEFEVASIRLSPNDEPQSKIRPAGSQITFGSFSIQELMAQAWQLPTGAMIGNVPPWLGQTRYTILVKLPPGIDARALSEDRDQIAGMLQKLLIDRFQIKYHWGQQTQDGYVLLAGTPKMKRADPTSRSYCKYGPPESEKDIRTAESPFNGEFHCQNVTMAQLADLAQPLMRSEIKNRVADKTGLAGSYDFTVYYTTARKLRADVAASQAAARQGSDASSDPVVGFTIEEAFRKQLGLKLEKQPGTYPALILDHIEKTPTEN